MARRSLRDVTWILLALGSLWLGCSEHDEAAPAPKAAASATAPAAEPVPAAALGSEAAPAETAAPPSTSAHPIGTPALGTPALGTLAEQKGAPAAPKIGVDNPDNAPALVALGRQIRKCAYDKRVDGKRCPAFKRLGEVAVAVEGEQGFSTLIHFLGDLKPAVRFAAAYHMRLRTYPGDPFSKSENLDAVLAALGKEKDGGVLEELGALVGKFDVSKAGREADVIGILNSHPRYEARKGLLLSVLFTNPHAKNYFETIRETARSDKDVRVRRAALGAFWNIGTERRDEIVALWREALQWPEEKLASHAAYMLGHWQKGVEEAFGDVIKATRARAKDGTISWGFLSGLFWYVKNGQPFVKKEIVLKACQDVVSNPKVRWNARNRAMDLMKLTGLPQWRTVVRVFTKDPQALVAKHAQKLLGEKSLGKKSLGKK